MIRPKSSSEWKSGTSSTYLSGWFDKKSQSKTKVWQVGEKEALIKELEQKRNEERKVRA